jgi:hypothetical protein
MEIEMLSIGKNKIRELAIRALNNSNGLDKKAYEILSIMLIESGNEDILEQVDIAGDIAFIGEDFAEDELEKLEKIDRELFELGKSCFGDSKEFTEESQNEIE